MTSHPPSTPIRKAPLFTPYVVVWTAFGALSLGLLGVIGLAPEWLDDLRPTTQITDPQSNQGQRASARIAADVNALKDSVAKIQLDLAKVTTEVATQSQQQKNVTAQVTALETRLLTGTTVAKSELVSPPAMPAEPVHAAGEPVRATSDPAAPVPPPAARAPKVINADAATVGTALETGSVTAPPKAAADVISFGPAIVKPAPQPLGIKISSGASADSLRLSWSLLAEKHGDTLKGLEARYLTGGDALNPSYDLVAGPIKTKAEATKVCKSLSAKGVPCTIGAFTGDAL